MKADEAALRSEFGRRLIRLEKQAAALLDEIRAARRISICDCGAVFTREGKRHFCSTRCQSRVYMRRFRARAR